jgi:hypothetical protein
VGELPRTYLFDADRGRGFSGLVAEEAFACWIERNGIATPERKGCAMNIGADNPSLLWQDPSRREPAAKRGDPLRADRGRTSC